METRLFGRSGMHLSVLGFGCGAVGGLMVRGDPIDQERSSQALLLPASTTLTRPFCTATANRKRISAASCTTSKPPM